MANSLRWAPIGAWVIVPNDPAPMISRWLMRVHRNGSRIRLPLLADLYSLNNIPWILFSWSSYWRGTLQLLGGSLLWWSLLRWSPLRWSLFKLWFSKGRESKFGTILVVVLENSIIGFCFRIRPNDRVNGSIAGQMLLQESYDQRRFTESEVTKRLFTVFQIRFGHRLDRDLLSLQNFLSFLTNRFLTNRFPKEVKRGKVREDHFG